MGEHRRMKCVRDRCHVVVHLADLGGFKPLLGVGDHQFHAAQAGPTDLYISDLQPEMASATFQRWVKKV